MPMRSRPSYRHSTGKSRLSVAKLQQQQNFLLDQLPTDFGATFQVQSFVIDNLSVNFGHSTGHFSSVNQSVRQIYQLLVVALCRHDPLPLMVRSTIKSTVFPASPPPPPPSPLALRPSSPQTLTRTLSPHPPVFERQHRSEVETITALDIPYALRHFDFDLSVVNNSETSAGEPTTLSAFATTAAVNGTCDPPIGSTISFSLARSEIRSNRGALNLVNARACRRVADLLVGARMFWTVRRAVKDAAASLQPIGARILRRQQQRGSEIWNTDGSNCTMQSKMFAPPNSAFDTSPAGSSESSESVLTASSTTSVSMRPSLRTITTGFGALSMTAPITVGLDGSNSNRESAQQMLRNSQQRSVSADSATALSDGVGRGSTSSGARSVDGGAGRLCPLHAKRKRAPFSESSCAVCASQHFLHRHLQRLTQETGGLGRLESILNDCIRLQENWCKSLNWVAGSVKDNRLPDSLRSLIRSICFDAGSCGTGCGQSFTLNPQIIISTDGRCNSLSCVSRCVSGSGNLPAVSEAAAPGRSGLGGAAGGWRPGSGGH